jgi:hypothetical protein
MAEFRFDRSGNVIAWCRGCHAFTKLNLANETCWLCDLPTDTNPPGAPALNAVQLEILFTATEEPQ